MSALEVGPDTYDRLVHARWPGNVRELAAAVERLVVFGESTEVASEPASGTNPNPSRAFGSEEEQILTLREVSLRHVEAVLAKMGGDKAKAGAALGIDVSTIYRWRQRAREHRS